MNISIICCCLEFVGDNSNCTEHGYLYKRSQVAITENPTCFGCGHPESVHPAGVCFVTLVGGSMCQCDSFHKSIAGKDQ